MPSKFKSKFTGFLRQMSNATAADGPENSNPSVKLPSSDTNGGCFIQRYLNGESRMKQPDILFGRTGQELPCLRVSPLQSDVIAAYTGPDGGLTTVNRGERKHVDSHDPDVLFIDSEDEAANNVPATAPVAGQVRIRAMGQTFLVTNHLPSQHPPPPVVSPEGDGDGECNDDDLSTVCEGPLSPPFSPTLSSLSLPDETAVSVSYADDVDRSDDYQELFSSFGLPSLLAERRQSTTLITSPDDTLVFSAGSMSPPLDDQLIDPFLPSPAAGPEPEPTKQEDGEEVNAPTSSAEDPPPSAPSGGAEPPEEIAGITGWNRPGGMAFGAATSLYERHPVNGETAGNPVADAFAIVARCNNALLCLADGVNWGERAALAARSAIHGAMDYLNRALFGAPIPTSRHLTTSDIFLCLLRSFHSAHSMILQEGGLLTTLTAAVVAQMDQSSSQNALYCGSKSNSAKFIVCVCNVGDSLAYVYSPKHGVREITHGSHDVNSMRDMRDALGALGPVDGQNPELNNLTCSMTIVEEGDIVFLTSDGVSDNFDPVVGKFVVAKKPDKIIPLPTNGTKQATNRPSHRSLPTVEAFQRHELTLLRMEDILRNGMSPSGDNGNHLKAQQLCEDLVDFATRLTMAKRRLLEDPELYVDQDGKPLDTEEQKARRRKICERLALIPGKLDHATVVAYEARIQPVPATQLSVFRESAI